MKNSIVIIILFLVFSNLLSAQTTEKLFLSNEYIPVNPYIYNTNVYHYVVGTYEVTIHLANDGLPRLGTKSSNNQQDTIVYLDTNVKAFNRTIFMDVPYLLDSNLYIRTDNPSIVKIVDAFTGEVIVEEILPINLLNGPSMQILDIDTNSADPVRRAFSIILSSTVDSNGYVFDPQFAKQYNMDLFSNRIVILYIIDKTAVIERVMYFHILKVED